jgi:hypothetical protein
MTKRRMQLALGVIVAFALAAGGHDGKKKNGKGDRDFSARLDSYQETPSLNSPGRGTFRAEVSNDQITFRLDYSNLTGPAAVAHVHIGQRGVAGGVSYFLCGGGGKPACPTATSGTVTGTVVAADVVGPTAQGFNPGDLVSVLAAMRAGVTYANVHTAKFPAGEIRGQLRGGHGHDEDDND